MLKIACIGDIHFKKISKNENLFFDELIRILTSVKDSLCKEDDMIIIFLGDTLHTFQRVDSMCQNFAVDFFLEVAKIAPTFVLVGNHDFHDKASAFCGSNRHSLYPIQALSKAFGEWTDCVYDIEELSTGNEETLRSPCIVNDVVVLFYKDFSLTLCPFVTEGTLISSLDSSHESTFEDWRQSDFVFGHAEVKGCSKARLQNGNDILSATNDVWEKDFPFLISGHIHHSHFAVSKRVFYTGSSRQTSHGDGETHEKSVWVLELDSSLDNSDTLESLLTEIPITGVPGMVDVFVDTLDGSENVKNVVKKVKSLLKESHSVKVHFRGTASSIQLFSQHKLFTKDLAHHPSVTVGYEISDLLEGDEVEDDNCDVEVLSDDGEGSRNPTFNGTRTTSFKDILLKNISKRKDAEKLTEVLKQTNYV